MPSASRVSICVAAVCLLTTVVSAPTANAQETPPVVAPAAAVEPRHEAEQNLIGLPTVQPLRRFAHHFRITHRFARDLTLGGFGPASITHGADPTASTTATAHRVPRSRHAAAPAAGNVRGPGVLTATGRPFPARPRRVGRGAGKTDTRTSVPDQSDECLRHDLRQTARGGERRNIYLGFNLARKW